MKITIDRQSLSDAVSHVSRAVSTKSTIPALEGVLLCAESGKLSIIAYNLEIGMTKILECRVEEEGEIIVNAKLFGDIIRRLPGETMTFSADERMMCEITGGSAKFDIIGLATSEFPEMPSAAESTSVTLSGNLLRGMVRQTIFAVAQNDAKPVHTGILFELSGGIIRLVAVDGFRLAIREEKIPEEIDLRFIAAGKAIGEAVKLIGEEDEEVILRVGKRHISFEINGYTLISRLLEGEFLDYNNTVPKVFGSTSRVNTREISGVVERISMIISDRLKSPIRCRIEGDLMDMSCATSIGKAEDHCAIKLSGAPIEIGFNNRYLLDALKAAETDEVLMEFNGAFAPMVIKPVEGESFLFMVMPVRLKNEV